MRKAHATPLHFLVLTVAVWLNRELQHPLDNVLAENEMLRARIPRPAPGRGEEVCETPQVGETCHALCPAQRERLATLVTSKTLLSWYRRLVANKDRASKLRTCGGPPLKPELISLILETATTTPIRGGHRISAN